MRVNAVRFVRKMRGGAQAHLLEADDGHFYIVKFQNNPQHRRVLVNEWIASACLHHLRIATPETAVVRLSAGFIANNPDVWIENGSGRRTRIAPGAHFGSRFPGNPEQVAVYDQLPATLLARVENRNDFLGVLVFDKWTGNADARQAIFLRTRVHKLVPSFEGHTLQVGFVALMIDHGYIFNGPNWTYLDSPLTGLYFPPTVYAHVRGVDAFQPWLERVVTFPQTVLSDAVADMPAEWLAGDSQHLDDLLQKLMARRSRTLDAIQESRLARIAVFPSWRS
jgi:hypothetical protein